MISVHFYIRITTYFNNLRFVRIIITCFLINNLQFVIEILQLSNLHFKNIHIYKIFVSNKTINHVHTH